MQHIWSLRCADHMVSFRAVPRRASPFLAVPRRTAPSHAVRAGLLLSDAVVYHLVVMRASLFPLSALMLHGTMTSTSFWTIFRAFLGSTPTPLALWAVSTWCPVVPHADWCLQSDAMPNLGLQASSSVPLGRPDTPGSTVSASCRTSSKRSGPTSAWGYACRSSICRRI